MSQQFVRSQGIETAPMKDEIVLFNASNNSFCVLNRTAAFIWERLAEPQTIETICSALAANYAKVPAGAIADDVSNVLNELQRTSCVVALTTG